LEVVNIWRILVSIVLQSAIPWDYCRARSFKHLEDMGTAGMKNFRMAYSSK
jgi:hypothetical protein